MQQILGQPSAVALLQSALKSGRVHHAWIFAGPFGVGKFTTALDFAAILLDRAAAPNPAGDIAVDPQGRPARLVAARAHPDLHVIYKELALYSDNRTLRERKLLNIPLDLLREHMLGGRTSDDRMHDAPAYRTPLEAPRKVFIVDEAELLDATAQNALLKTLEEPPLNTVIVLVSSRPERLLPTIRSRSQHVRFRPLDRVALAKWFERSGLDLAPAERAWIESYCQGSPGVAVLAARYGFHRWHQTLEPMLDDLSAGRFPLELGQTLAALADEFADAWVKANENASKDAANKAGAGHLLRLLATHVQRALADRCGGEGWRGDCEALAASVDLLRAAELQIDANVNQKHVFENLAAQWSA